jgi:hypothetical protein
MTLTPLNVLTTARSFSQTSDSLTAEFGLTPDAA